MSAQAPQNAHGKQWEYYTDMPVGEILRRARTHYGQSLNDVEAILRIRAAQLGALEDGKLADLPGRVYAIGFVRAYSEYLGLDGDKMVHLFKIQSVGNKARPELNFPVAASESKLPGLLLLGISFAAVVAIVVMFSFFHTGSAPTAQEEIPAVSPQMKAEAATPVPSSIPAVPLGPVAPVMAAVPAAPQGAPAGTLVTAATPAPAAAVPAKPVSRIVINIRETTWVEIRNSSGKAIISQVLNPGEQYNVPNEEGMVLATGNIGGLEFVIDGQPIPPLGNKGDVARGIKLNADAMKPKTKAAAPAAFTTTAQPYNAAAPLTPAQNAAWQGAIRPAAPAQTAAPQAAPLPQTPAPQTAATAAPAATTPKYVPPADKAYKPNRLPGASRGRSGGNTNSNPYNEYDSPYGMDE